jgi:hypothetical protein
MVTALKVSVVGLFHMRTYQRVGSWRWLSSGPTACQVRRARQPSTGRRQLRSAELDELVKGYQTGATVYDLAARFSIDRRTERDTPSSRHMKLNWELFGVSPIRDGREFTACICNSVCGSHPEVPRERPAGLRAERHSTRSPPLTDHVSRSTSSTFRAAISLSRARVSR